MQADQRLKVWDCLERVATAGRDVAASDFVEGDGVLAALQRHWIKLQTSAEPEEVSALDYGRYEDTHINLQVCDGYGALLARLAAVLPVVLSSPVSWIAAAGNRMRVETPNGIIAADHVIVTASVNVIASGSIRFSPGLPAVFTDALAAVPCGTYEKIAVAVEDGTFADYGHASCDIAGPQGSEPMFTEIAPFGRPVAIGHIAGHFARDLEREGPAARIALFTDKLALAFGSSIRKSITVSATTGWISDPFIRGGYATARPGNAEARVRMIEADFGPLHFAGEAFNLSAFSTAHGAFLSGQAVAMKAAAHLGHDAGAADPLWLPPELLLH